MVVADGAGVQVAEQRVVHRDALAGVLTGDLLHRFLRVGTDLMAMQAEEGAAEHLKQQLIGPEAAEADAIGTGETTPEDLVDHQVVAVGGERITPAQLLAHPAFIAGDAIHLDLELFAQIQQKGLQDVHRQQGGPGAVGGIAEQLIKAAVAVEEIPQAGHHHLAGAVAHPQLPDALGELGQPLCRHREVVAVGGQFNAFIEVQITELHDQHRLTTGRDAG